MTKIFISEAMRMITEAADRDDIETANEMLKIISCGISQLKEENIFSREVELRTNQEKNVLRALWK